MTMPLRLRVFGQTVRCVAGVLADVPDPPSPQLVLGALWSHLSLNESHLLCFWCGGRGEQSEAHSRKDSCVYVARLSPACVSGSLEIYSFDTLSH